MEKIKNKKIAFTVGLLIIIALLAVTVFSILNLDDQSTYAYAINSNAKNSTIGNHGVGEIESLPEGSDDAVRTRFGVGSNYSVVWVADSNELKQHLETASGAVTAAQNKIIVFKNGISWEQSNINSDVGSQKFAGILDGNGYELNITFSSTVKGGGSAKASNNSYYKVTQSDIGESENNFPSDNGDGVRGVGLVVGVNAGTIANLTINYNIADGAMRDGGTVDSNGKIEDTNSLDSAQDPDAPYGYGIVTGVNIGTIQNVYVNQKAIFNGNTKARNDGSGIWSPATPFRNCSAVGGIAGVNMGYGLINNCYMYVGGAIWAQADGSESGGSSNARFSSAFAGGIAGWIKGNNAQITYCYLDGNGDINSWAQRGRVKVLTGQNYAWSLSFAGGVTAGKIAFRENDNVYYADAQAMNANQIKGIISNWTGYRRDSYGKTSYVDVTNTYSSAARAKIGMPFDYLYSMDQIDMIVFTYSYKTPTSNETLDLDHTYESATLSPAKMTSGWSEFYQWEHGSYTGKSSVSITFEGTYLRVQAKSDSFMETQSVQLESVTRAEYTDGFSPSYGTNYIGSMIWETDIYTIGQNINPESSISSSVSQPSDKWGSFVRYYSSTMSKGSYVVKFGATYDYSLKNNMTVSKQYDGENISNMMPSFVLSDGTETGNITPNEGYYNWVIEGAESGAVGMDLTKYPDTYSIYPVSNIGGVENQDYAYYDASSRTLAVIKDKNSVAAKVVVSTATLSLKYSESGWVSSATIPVEFSTNGNDNLQKIVIDAYSYEGGTNSNKIPLNLVGNNNFSITETGTTPQNGRKIYNVVAYAKKQDGSYVSVAKSTNASFEYRTAVIKIDNDAPVLLSEKYYLANQFGSTNVDDIKAMLDSNPDDYTALDNADVMSGRWYNESLIAVASLSDENRSGISIDTIGIQQAVKGGNFGNMAESNYSTSIEANGNATIVMYIASEMQLRVSATDVKGNSTVIDLNGANFIEVDTTPITFNPILGKDLSVTYNYVDAAGKAFSKLNIGFNVNFGNSGLYVWYYIDNNTSLGNEVTEAPADATWVKYEFTTAVTPNTRMTVLIPEDMENAAVFVKFTSGVEGYDVADPITMRVTTSSYSKFTVDLNGADIQFFAQYIDVKDNASGTTYRLDTLVNGGYDVSLSDLFSKSYDGTNMLNSNIEFAFNIGSNVPLVRGTHYSGWFYANTEEGNFRTNWMDFDVKYTQSNAGTCYLTIALVTSEESNVNMKISIDYGGETGVQQTYSVATRIERMNMSFDIGQIFTEGADISMSAGSYSLKDGVVSFDWIYGDAFDGLVVSIFNNESGGTMSFRFKSQDANGNAVSGLMNAGGHYTAYVDAIKIDSPIYTMEEFATLIKNGNVYEGDAGNNYAVSISGAINIDVAQKEVRLTFRLDGNASYSFNIPYDGNTHIVTATYKDVNGEDQQAKITWKNSSDAVTTLTGITDIGSYTAVASIEDSNYVIKAGGQTQQMFNIRETYIDVKVPDKTAEYNDGNAITYIPDLPAGFVGAEDIVFTIIYYQKLGDSLKVVTYIDDDGKKQNAKSVSEVGEYFVTVTFDPLVQTNDNLKTYQRKEYMSDNSENGYISFTVVKSKTTITGVSDQTTTYNGAQQIINVSKAAVHSSGGTTFNDFPVKLQYWDEKAEEYVDFVETSNDGKYADAGSYMYRLVYEGSANYESSYLDLTFTINPATITGVVFGEKFTSGTHADQYGTEKFYSGDPVSLEADISNSNVKNESNVKVEYRRYAFGAYTTTPPSFTAVSDYQVWLRITCENYVTYETTAYIVIKTAPYPNPDDVLTFKNGNIVEFDYDGQEHDIEYTLNTEKYGDIHVVSSFKPQKNAGEYSGSLQVLIPNYESKTYPVQLIINAKVVTSIDISEIEQVQAEEGLTTDTDLVELRASFEGINGETVYAELVFWKDGEIVTPDADGHLEAGEYTVTFKASSNYDLSAIGSKKLTLEQGSSTNNNGENTPGGDTSGENTPGDNTGNGNVTPPKDAPDVVLYIVVAVCAVLIVASIAGVIVAAVVKSKKKNNNNRYNII